MKNGIGYLPEDRKGDGIIQDLSVRENIILALQVLNGFFKPFSRAESEKFADEFIELLNIKTASKETPIKSLSGGNQQKVILARWLLTNPQYLILDEPTNGLDPNQIIEIRELIREIGKNTTIILSTHIMQEVEALCSRVILLNKGEIVADQPIEEFKGQYQNLEEAFQALTK